MTGPCPAHGYIECPWCGTTPAAAPPEVPQTATFNPATHRAVSVEEIEILQFYLEGPRGDFGEAKVKEMLSRWLSLTPDTQSSIEIARRMGILPPDHDTQENTR